MWADESVFYQIYPMGFAGAPFENDGVQRHGLSRFAEGIPHLKKLGVNAVYFSPIFESDTHGYNTRDYTKIDVRLGTNEEFAELVKKLHEEKIKVVIDGVFNHVGRGFWAFRDVQEKRWDSQFKDWFHLSFDGNSNYNDGLWYEGWEGNYDLVKLNLKNDHVVEHILGAVKGWVDEFDIDGLRLDVAYCLDRGFLSRLRHFTDGLKEDFFLVGEMIHGDYNQFMNDNACHSVTNYECYKGLYSSFNSMNMYEIIHSLLRQFGPENWTLYKGKHLLNFVDNHDVSRVASILNNEKHLPVIYGLLFAMPGIPMIYYGSEWGVKADKSQGDPALRPHFEKPEWNSLTDMIAAMSRVKRESEALNYGEFKSLVLTNRQCVFERRCGEKRVIAAFNADGNPFDAHYDYGLGKATELLSGREIEVNGCLHLEPYSVMYIQG